MNFWWVNQNQTARQEIGGGYMWSPKRNKNGARNAFYENMRECAPGDIVFSFVDTKISTMGIVQSLSEQSSKPKEFGETGDQWDADGWRVRVDYRSLPVAIRPVEHMDSIRPTLPNKYSPLQPDGRGNQVYLARVPPDMALVLVGLIGVNAQAIVSEAAGGAFLDIQSDADSREDAIEQAIQQDSTIHETERQSLVRSRRGQGLFRDKVAKIETKCRVTGVTNPSYRIASHIKPWKTSDNRERLDGNNGLLLAPQIDHLFDRGLIAFKDDGTLLISPAADVAALGQLGVPVGNLFNAGAFSDAQKSYLEYHRSEVFLKSSLSDN